MRSNQLDAKASLQLGYRRRLGEDVEVDLSKGTSARFAYGADLRMDAQRGAESEPG